MRINKPKEMMRSILPSKARNWASHKKRNAHRANRRSVNVLLSEYDLDDDDDSEFITEMNCADTKRVREIRYVVRERRGADKINHFIRWAIEKTKHLDDIREKYYRFVSNIGGCGDVIRRHAVSHFIDPRYDFRKEYGSWWGWRFRTSIGESQPEVSDKMLSEKISLAIRHGMENKLNNLLRGIRFRECRKTEICCKESMQRYTVLVWEIRPDGTRRRLFGHIREGEPYRPTQGIVSYNSCYKTMSHSDYRCRNMVQFDGVESIPRIIRFLRRKKKADAIRLLWSLVQDL